MIQNNQTDEDISRILNASSIALVGATNDPQKFGCMTLDCLIRGGYKGRIYPVNPKGGSFLGIKGFTSVSDIPEPLDLVIIIVPAKFVPDILKEAANKGAVGAVICSGGFREAGRADLEEEILSVARESRLRLLGPNISGIAYLPNKMCAQFYPVLTQNGPIAIVSQSGTITNGLAEWASDEGIGVSGVINLGNQADLCESDYLQFFANDKNTKTIVMYIEGVKNGQRFLKALKMATQRKSVAIIKGGRSAAGQRSTASHTGSLASNYQVFSAACRQFGATIADDIETLYDSAKALAMMREPKGKRIMCISTSGGANTLAMDETERWGLEVPCSSESFVKELTEMGFSPLADFSNPIDLVSLKTDDFKRVALTMDKYRMADVLLINFGDPIIGDLELIEFLDAKVKASLAVSYYAGGDQEKIGRQRIQKAGFPVFPTPERAIRGIAAKVNDTNYRQSHTLNLKTDR